MEFVVWFVRVDGFDPWDGCLLTAAITSTEPRFDGAIMIG